MDGGQGRFVSLVLLGAGLFSCAGLVASASEISDELSGDYYDQAGQNATQPVEPDTFSLESTSLESESLDTAEFDTSLVDSGSCAPADDCCDCKKQAKLSKAVAGAYKPLFYDNNFDYLCDPCYCDSYLGENLKRNCLGDCMVWDIGGQYRARYHREQNMRGLGLTGRDDSFLLHRTRLYANLEIGHRFRVYAEMLDAVSEFEDFAPRPIEESRANLQNAFADIMLWEGCSGDMWARIGRQELLFGSQRTVSPLDWANTRRTFEGGKVFWKGEDWDADAFWTHPVSPAGDDFQSTDDSQDFMGFWSSYKGFENEAFDFYYLRYTGSTPNSFNYNTFGTRYHGSRGQLLWDCELDYQFGNVAGDDQAAWAYTFGLGYKMPCVCWTPTFWAYYDFATGDDGGNGYHHMFPLAHKYLGFMDLFGRRNLEDLNFLATVQPTKKLKLLAWWHIFKLQNNNDIPYNVVMGPSPSPVPGDNMVPGGSGDLGQELDLQAIYNFTPRTKLVLGYSHFWAGQFFSTNTSPGLFNGDADFFYTQFSQDF